MTQTPAIPTLPSPRAQAEARFIALMTELFQLAEAQALDFGLYRVIRRHNREVRAFLGEIVTGPDGPRLQGGRLSVLLDQAFAAAGDEAEAGERQRLADLEGELGLKPGMTRTEREEALTRAEAVPAAKGLVRDYRAGRDALAGRQTLETDRAEVLNRLYQFFSRHYQDGDFIVERRYGRDGARYIRSTGEDTEFHWATEDMYYTKSGDSFTDCPVRLSGGQRLCFTLEPETLQATRAALKPSDRAHYELDSATKQDGVLSVRLRYLKGAQSEKQKDEIVAAVLKAARILRALGGEIIAFLAALEGFQKALWEKKKLVLETRYVITLDRLERYAPQWLADHIDGIVVGQCQEWRSLGLGDYPDAAACRRAAACPQAESGQAAFDLPSPPSGIGPEGQYLPLPADTRHFPVEFKWSLLQAVTAVTPLDKALDGIAIHSDNWQALDLLREKYRERVKCIYIDPPYNTGGDGFPYKDSYRSASWMAMMEDRLHLGVQTLMPSGVLFASIDQNEYPKLRALLETVMGGGNALGTVVWKNVTDNNPTNIAVEHEYVECFARNRGMLESEWKSPYSEAKDLLVGLGQELLGAHGDTAQLRVAYQDWFRANKTFLGPPDWYKYIDAGGGGASGAEPPGPVCRGLLLRVRRPRIKAMGGRQTRRASDRPRLYQRPGGLELRRLRAAGGHRGGLCLAIREGVRCLSSAASSVS